MNKKELKELIDKEQFYFIPGYEELYLMNRLGEILSLRRKVLLKPVTYVSNLGSSTSLVCALYKNKKAERHSVYKWYSKTFGTIEYRRRKVCQI